MCYRKFEPGSTLYYSAGIYEGEFCSCYICLTCDSIIKLVPTDEEGYPEGFVFEGLNKDETPEMYLQRLQNDYSSQLTK